MWLHSTRKSAFIPRCPAHIFSRPVHNCVVHQSEGAFGRQSRPVRLAQSEGDAHETNHPGVAAASSTSHSSRVQIPKSSSLGHLKTPSPPPTPTEDDSSTAADDFARGKSVGSRQPGKPEGEVLLKRHTPPSRLTDLQASNFGLRSAYSHPSNSKTEPSELNAQEIDSPTQRTLHAEEFPATSSAATLFVSNLPIGCAAEQIEDLFKPFAPVSKVTMTKYPSGRLTGEAQVFLTSVADAQECLRIFTAHSPMIGGYEVLVSSSTGRRLEMGRDSPKLPPGAKTSFLLLPKESPAHIRDDGSPSPALVPESDTCRVYVGNLHWRIDERELAEFMSTMGSVVDTQIITMQDGSSAGYGFVTFARPEDVACVLERSQQKALTIMDRSLILSPHKSSTLRAKRPLPSNSREGHEEIPERNVLYVSNVPWSYTQTELEKFLANIAPVATIVPGKVDGRVQAFFHVFFQSTAGATAVIEKHAETPLVLGMRTLNVDYARHVPNLSPDIDQRFPHLVQGVDVMHLAAEPVSTSSETHDLGRLYVSNIPRTVSEQELRSVFQKIAPVGNVAVLTTLGATWSAHLEVAPDDARIFLRYAGVRAFQVGGAPIHVTQSRLSPQRAETNRRNPTALAVEGLPDELVAADELQQAFGHLSSVPKIEIIPNEARKYGRPQALLHFRDSVTANKVLRVHKILPIAVQGHKVWLDPSPPLSAASADDEPRKTARFPRDASRTLFVDNLPWDDVTVETRLRQLFATYAVVKNVAMARSAQGLIGGFARVDMESSQSAQSIINAHMVTQLTLDGRRLHIKWARMDPYLSDEDYSDCVLNDDDMAIRELHVRVSARKSLDAVRRKFEQFGTVKQIMNDDEPASYKIEFAELGCAQRAMQAHMELPLDVDGSAVQMHYVLEANQSWENAPEDAIPRDSLYISLIPADVTREDILREVLEVLKQSSSTQQPTASRIKRFKLNHPQRSPYKFAYIYFHQVADAHLVRELHRTTPILFRGHACSMVYNHRSPQYHKLHAPAVVGSDASWRTLTLHGVPAKTTEEELHKLASEFEPPAKIVLGPEDRAHICFQSGAGARAMKAAIDAFGVSEDGGLVLGGRPVQLAASLSAVAKPKYARGRVPQSRR